MTSPNQNERQALIGLYPYQRGIVTDSSRFCLGVWSRQTGKDFSVSLKHVRKRIRRGGDSVCVCPSERQSLQAIEKVKMHCEAVKAKYDYDEIAFEGVEERAKAVIFKDNRARFLAFPGNPDTIRGFSADMWFNEAAFFKNAVAIWRAGLAIASRGFDVDMTSTPNGQVGVFWDICKLVGVSPMGGHKNTHWTANGWSVHWCDVHTAVAQGCPINIAELRQAMNDEDSWLQEYELHFLADAENYIPMELIIASESSDATIELPTNFVQQGELYLGGDIGRKKDRTVFWLKEKIGDVLWTRAVVLLDRTPFDAQWAVLDPLLAMVRRASLDSSGLGMQLAEQAVKKYGTSRVEAVTFNLENKERMATLQKKQMEERRERIPSAAFIRRSFNAVKRYSSPTGHFRFDADRTDAGHADEFWASALCTAAAATNGRGAMVCADAETQPRERRRGMMEDSSEQRENAGAYTQKCAECGEVVSAFRGNEAGDGYSKVLECRHCGAPLPAKAIPIEELAGVSVGHDRRGRGLGMTGGRR